MSKPTRARVYEEELVIPTYEVGPESRYAGFFHEGHGRIYPYTRRDDLLGRRKNVSYRAVYVENDYLKVVVLPELGGHLYGMYDKTNDREVFYRNHVIKPGLIGLRGAWIPTGIEFNFPVGHTVSTLSPVDYALIEEDDGFVGVEVSDIELVSRMKWSVIIGLHPDRMAAQVRVRLYNRTTLGHRYYYWANAAVKATDGLEFICDAPAAWNWRKPVSFPVTEDGRNIAWYRNYEHGADVFTLGGKNDFMGAYDHDGDAGVVHIGKLFELPGRKFFTWGRGERGDIWTNVLTDDDGPYIEIQRGRFPTQADYGFLEPGELVEWNEHWYPVREMSGVACAALDASANLSIHVGEDTNTAFVAVNVTRAFPELTVRLEEAGSTVFEETLPLSPQDRYRRQVPVSSSDIHRYKLTLKQADHAVLSYAPAPAAPINTKDYEHLMPEGFRFQVQRRNRRGKHDSTEDKYRSAILAIKWNQWKRTRSLFENILKDEPDHVGALVGVGRVEIWGLRYREAEEHLKRAAVLDREHPRAHFYLGVARRLLGDDRGAREAFYQIAKRGVDLAHAARWQLGEMAALDGDYEDALDHLEQAARYSLRANRPEGILAAVFRRTGRLDDARSLAHELVQRDATDFVALNELRLALAASGESAQAKELQDELSRRMRRTVHCYIESALEYASAGLYQEAVEILRSYKPGKVEDCAGEAMLYYYLAWLIGRASPGSDEVASWLKKAKAACCDHVFPNRHEAEAALLFALTADEGDHNAHHFLGNLYASRFQVKRAMAHWRKALLTAPDSPVVLRNLGLAFWQELGRANSALPYYKKAVKADPGDYRLLAEADRLYSDAGKPALRAKLWKLATPQHMEHNEFRTRFLYYLAETARYEKAADFLEQHTFYSTEGGFGIRRIYDDVHVRLALKHFDAGRCDAALEEIGKLDRTPANLLVDASRSDSDSRKCLLEGDILKAMGKDEEAKEAYRRGAKHHGEWISTAIYFCGLCQKRLGDKKGLRNTTRYFERGLKHRHFLWPWITETEVMLFEALLLLLKNRKSQAKEKLKEVKLREPFNRDANYLLEHEGDVF